ncbi:Fc receptor-like protein 5 isoform X2 [Toxotes jaculatrix]|uniref:Fc receptor-like protein 5 isoform X2 n=1 Tax=Toxotes jaculatrix TaxID=941984 RepID=UPI001B3AF51B|nr:Fc receptor-like protein 5 isoform X2 [Toxotes jaculatrix]
MNGLTDEHITTQSTLLFYLTLVCPCPSFFMSSVLSASVTVVPNRSQYFEYEQISVSCEHFRSGEWTVWRYTTGLELSQCGSGWGDQASTSCVMETVKKPSSGVYWCESKHRRSSDAVNITVTVEPVILESPVLPVTERDDVTLRCKTSNSASYLTADFYKDNIFIGSKGTGHMTIHNFSKSDEGVYRCAVHGLGQSPSSWLLVREDSEPASLTPSPDSSQLTEYENLSLSCGDDSSFRGWRIKRFTTVSGKLSSCGDEWGTPTSSGCVLQTVKQRDSAVYWCESPSKRRSNSVNITVYDGPVILQSPVLPVMDGHDVSLLCKTKDAPSDLPADFYKDGSFIRTEPTGHMTIRHVSRSDEGVYSCKVRGHGESPPSWLFVTDADAQDSAPVSEPTPSLLTALRYIVVCSPYFISTLLMASEYRRRPTGRTLPVSMTMPPASEDDDGVEGEYDDAVAAGVTTEHHF